MILSAVREALDWTLYPLVDRIRPVRIGVLSPKGRLSVTILYAEPFLRKARRNASHRSFFPVLIDPGKTPNSQLARMIARNCLLIDARRPLLRKVAANLYRGVIAGTRWDAGLKPGWRTDPETIRTWNEDSPALAFTPQEQEQARKLLASMNLTPATPYLCFGTREARYYREFHPERTHWEETFHRNSPIGDYLPAAEWAISEGMFAVRMGAGVEAALPEGRNPRIIDYAWNHRTDFGDIALGAHCRFAVTGSAGFCWIATAFNRPVLWANQIYIQYRPVRDNDLFICKKLWSTRQKRLLTFREMIEASDRYDWRANCEADEIEVIHNTSEEITAAVQEMKERLDGTWGSSGEDEELQGRFQALYEPHHLSAGFRSRMGAAFLRQHAQLLGDRP